MRFSEWRAKAPFKESVSPRVMSVVEPALGLLGTDSDPDCWIAWGDDPRIRYTIFVPTPSGLCQLVVRVAVPGEGPRAGGKIIRWGRVQLGEFAVEMQAGHRLVTFQVETQVLNGADAAADAIAVFAQRLYAAVDGRAAAAAPLRKGRAASAAGKSGTAAKPRAARVTAATTTNAPVRRLAAKGSTR